MTAVIAHDSYSAPSGKSIHGGRWLAPNAVLDLIRDAPENSWVQLNTNTFQDAWSPADARQAYPYTGVGAEIPEPILGKWGSMGWDSARSRAIVFGGGHANIGLNEVYYFSAYDRKWHLGFNATRIVQVNSYPTYRSVDGNKSPVSSHTYANNNYLPTIDRFYTGGGAAVGNGNSLMVWDGNTALRPAGGFTLDMTLAGQGYVAGEAGSNVKYGSFSADLPGANAWKLRDWGLNNPAIQATGWDGNSIERIECGTVVANENGHDTLYWLANGRLWRTEFFDDVPANDVITRISGYENAFSSNGAMALDPVRRIILKPNGRNPELRLFHMLDLNVNNTGGGFQSIYSMSGDSQAGFIGTSGLTTSSGIAYDERKGCFVLWMKGRQPWLIHAPSGSPVPSTGWEVEKPTMDTGTSCPPDTLDPNDSGVIGKFKYAPDLGCCVCIENITQGNVWALKLAGWTDPRS